MSEFFTELKAMMDQVALGDEEITSWVKKSKKVDSFVRIPGDASARKYYRVRSENKSYVVMKMDSFEEQAHNLPFLLVQKLLKENGIDVPTVFDIDPKKGLILLEDLGDITLLKKLQEVRTPDIERHLYEKVIDALVVLQVNAVPKKKSKQMDAFHLRFDYEKLFWEINFTIEHFYQLYLKRDIKSKDAKVLQDGFGKICKTLEKVNTVLAHRDFHSRNVMVLEDRFVMIDFQDARMGPPQYDLSSLLRDSYYQLEEAQVVRLMDYYIARYEALSGKEIEREQFLLIFDLMSVQRNFKAIGSFASFLNRRGDATYLKYIGNTFENIRRTLLKYPEYSALREVLFNYYYF